ncbi:MAG TPA: dihydrolipoyl dehydrogenase [Spirochaetia bacterium]|nr:dihydrolipoyl dehydrogenase [Spirochaetia bacterium]
MAEETKYDLIVIGSGPGGYVAAIRASQLGLRTAIIEKDRPGGVCLNIGCIPSKAIIHQAELFHAQKGLLEMGITVDASKFDYGVVFKKSRQAAERLSKGVQSLLKKNRVEYLTGTAKLVSAHEVEIDGKQKLTGKSVLIATGSRPREIPGFEFDEKQVISSTGALMLEKLPKKMIILGAGAIGMEFAHVMSTFGVAVTVVEMLDQILPLEDAETVDVVARDFKKRGIVMHTGTKATKLEKKKTAVTLTIEDKAGTSSTLEADILLVAVGRTPNTRDLGLEAIGVKLEKGFIVTGDYYETAVSGVYAIGDCIPTPLLAHVASKEGEIAVEHIAGREPENRIPDGTIPSAVYTEPQVASFGPTEARAKELGIPCEKAVFPYRGAGKSVAIEQPDGMVKILYAPDTHEILAAHVVGNSATELIHELLLARKAELLPEDIATMIHAHPTLSEAVMEAARSVEGWAIHI